MNKYNYRLVLRYECKYIFSRILSWKFILLLMSGNAVWIYGQKNENPLNAAYVCTSTSTLEKSTQEQRIANMFGSFLRDYGEDPFFAWVSFLSLGNQIVEIYNLRPNYPLVLTVIWHFPTPRTCNFHDYLKIFPDFQISFP